nr:serine--trna ligase, mitochondrial [Quercus suber]
MSPRSDINKNGWLLKTIHSHDKFGLQKLGFSTDVQPDDEPDAAESPQRSLMANLDGAKEMALIFGVTGRTNWRLEQVWTRRVVMGSPFGSDVWSTMNPSVHDIAPTRSDSCISQIRLDLADLAKLLPRVLRLHARRHDHVVPADPVDRRRHALAVAQLQAVDDAQDLGSVAAGRRRVHHGQADLARGVDDEDAADGEGDALVVDVGEVLRVDHVVEEGDLAVRVGDDGEREARARQLVDVLDPARVRAQVVGAQPDHLHVARLELAPQLREGAQLRRAHGCVVRRVREEDRPLVVQPAVEVDLAAVLLRSAERGMNDAMAQRERLQYRKGEEQSKKRVMGRRKGRVFGPLLRIALPWRHWSIISHDDCGRFHQLLRTHHTALLCFVVVLRISCMSWRKRRDFVVRGMRHAAYAVADPSQMVIVGPLIECNPLSLYRPPRLTPTTTPVSLWQARNSPQSRFDELFLRLQLLSPYASSTQAFLNRPRCFYLTAALRPSDLRAQTGFRPEAHPPEPWIREVVSLRQRANVIGKELKHLGPNNTTDAEGTKSLIQEARHIKEQTSEFEKLERSVHDQIDGLASELPNLSSLSTPSGSTPQVVDYINGTTPPANANTKSHVDIGRELDILDFEASATTSGWGWYFLKNEGALLEQALIQYTLSVARSYGWTIMTPPSLVYSHIASACGFLPRDQNGETQVYSIHADDPSKPQLVLAGTAEIPFAGSQALKTLSAASLPLKVIGPSRCYRAEAGARGVDTKGLYRVHEFTKVEMFAWTAPPPAHSDLSRFDDDDDASVSPDAIGALPSTAVFDEMLAIQRHILTALQLHARVLEMPATDLGASAQRKLDMEVYFPSRRALADAGYGEVSSASLCGDYQTRRLGTKVKAGRGGGGGGEGGFAHTLNGTALAVPRVLAAVLENGWDERRGAVVLPAVLRRWLPGDAWTIRRTKAA